MEQSNDKRLSWDEYFMEMAELTAKRSTCLRRHVGAVIVKDKHIIATGYNGAPRGIRHCDEYGGCLRQKLQIPSGQRHELCRALHAEQNAIIQAATLGQSIEGGTIYITHQPCVICAKMIINAGLSRIVVREGYPDDLAVEILDEAGLKIIMLQKQD
ncbi:deoxycytidylate deaminase [Ihubacter sp. rT4E-8]|uniref:deoxycytidylate deaminase n=1 Tax=unclassified Ihubacter TaxID=2633299 RepID=UPI00137B7377